MPTINIRNETYNRLALKAAATNTTIDRLVEPVLEQLAGDESAPHLRHEALADWMAVVKARDSRYPVGFMADDSRETIYEGRGE
jgi:hypothetical protein